MPPLPCKLRQSRTVVVDDHLQILFHRTNKNASYNMANLLPDQGTCHIHVSEPLIESNLQPDAVRQALFIQMRRKPSMLDAHMHVQTDCLPIVENEAMWIKFEASKLFLVRIYVDGVNAVTGRVTCQPGEQDYVVVPEQSALNRYKTSPQKMLQFHSPDFGGASRGGSSKRDIQLEITPYDKAECMAVTLSSPSLEKIPFVLNPKSTCEEVRTMITHQLGGLRESALRVHAEGVSDPSRYPQLYRGSHRHARFASTN